MNKYITHNFLKDDFLSDKHVSYNSLVQCPGLKSFIWSYLWFSSRNLNKVYLIPISAVVQYKTREKI